MYVCDVNLLSQGGVLLSATITWRAIGITQHCNPLHHVLATYGSSGPRRSIGGKNKQDCKILASTFSGQAGPTAYLLT